MLKTKNIIIASALAAALIITPALAADGQTTANLNTDMTVTSLGADNPLKGVDVGYYSIPTFADINGDGNLDVFIGESKGSINYYKNTGSASAPKFVAQTSTQNPLNFLDVGTLPTLAFADIDGDGDLDAFIGEYDGAIKYYENIGSASAPAFEARTGTHNPLNGFDVGFFSAPTFADIDGDSDLDVFIGESKGNINYYKNTGSASAPEFEAQTDVNNPLYIDVGSYSASTFADIDGDGDLDAFVGANDGTINYYKNTGSVSAPTFTKQTDTNPLNLLDVGFHSTPTFVDIDGDSDLDVFIGEWNGTINYYKNIGSSTLPNFLN